MPFAILVHYLTGHYEKIFKNCHLKYQGDGPTGILLIYPQHAIHCLEAPLELLNTVIADLEELGKQKYVKIRCSFASLILFH